MKGERPRRKRRLAWENINKCTAINYNSRQENAKTNSLFLTTRLRLLYTRKRRGIWSNIIKRVVGTSLVSERRLEEYEDNHTKRWRDFSGKARLWFTLSFTSHLIPLLSSLLSFLPCLSPSFTLSLITSFASQTNQRPWWCPFRFLHSLSI